MAGSPDASDWSAILKEQDTEAKNNNQQIRINTRLFDATHEMVGNINNIISKVNSMEGDLQATTTILHKAIILAGQAKEIARACQLAKTGVVNTNLLDHGELEAILDEVDNLPYQNAIEAVEFSRPSILSNGTMLLYVLAFPKVLDREYRRGSRWPWSMTTWH